MPREHYATERVPLIVLAGKDYGMGSSRDWAAKGTFLLGVRAVLAESFERIHRSNLVGMGVVPLQYPHGVTAATLGLTGKESFDIRWPEVIEPRQDIEVVISTTNGTQTSISARLRVDTPVEVEYLANGGILHTVLRRMAFGT